MRSLGPYTKRIIQAICTQIEYYCTKKFSMNKNSHIECKILTFSTNFSFFLNIFPQYEYKQHSF